MKLASHAISLFLGVALGVMWSTRPAPKRQPAVEPPAVEESQSSAAAPANDTATSAPKIEKPVLEAPKPVTANLGDLESALGQEDLQNATAIVEALEKSAPGSREALEGRAKLLMRQRNPEAARAVLKRCVELHPTSRECWVDRTKVELQVGLPDEQASAVKECLNAVPNDPMCKSMLAKLRTYEEDYDGAVKVLDEVIRDNGRFGPRVPQENLDLEMALTLEEAGREDEAMTYYDKACRANKPEACRKVEELRGLF